jgi:hypothetical protein
MVLHENKYLYAIYPHAARSKHYFFFQINDSTSRALREFSSQENTDKGTQKFTPDLIQAPKHQQLLREIILFLNLSLNKHTDMLNLEFLLPKHSICHLISSQMCSLEEAMNDELVGFSSVIG